MNGNGGGHTQFYWEKGAFLCVRNGTKCSNKKLNKGFIALCVIDARFNVFAG